MRIEIVHQPPLRRWQARLADGLAREGHEVTFVAGAGRWPGLVLVAALAFQQRLFGPRPALFERLANDSAASPGRSASADLVIALDGEQAEGPCVLEPVFDGGLGEAAALSMLSRRHSPRCVEIRARISGGTCDLVAAQLAIEDPDILSRALDQMLARLVTLILQGVRRLERAPLLPLAGEGGLRVGGGRMKEVGAVANLEDYPLLPRPLIRPLLTQGPPSPASGRRNARPLLAVARGLLFKAATRLPGMKRGPNHWRVGYRRLRDTAIVDRDLAESFTILPDDGARFYADPMPFEHEGRRYLFLEDYPYATGKAVVAVTEIDAAGAAPPPRPVLEQPFHLSYPLVLRHGAEIFMLPETSGAGRVQLFRAAPFPDRWLPDRVLLDGVVAADATPIEHGGRWWMFATLADDGGSSWDQLCLFHAPDLFGPWTAHADNPVLVDAGAARPAGAMWHEDGVLMRVAQDCRDGYGRGLAVCRVDRLDETGYAQTVVARLAPPEGYGADGVHTLGRVGGLEVIDLRFPPAGR